MTPSRTLKAAAPTEFELFTLHPRKIWKYLLTQPASFWLVNIYLFFEYVRPQSMYPALNVLPWAQLVLLASLGAVILEGRFPRPRTHAGAWLMVFSVIVVLSSVFAVRPQVAYAAWELYFSWVLIFLLITNTITTEKRFFIFSLAYLLYSFKMSQHGFTSWAGRGFAFANWGVIGAPGWFHNSGEFGIQMCVFLPLSVEFILALRKYWNKWVRWASYLMPITAIGTIVATSSRGALLGAGCVALWWIARTKHRVKALVGVAVIAAVTWFAVPQEQKVRFARAGEDQTSQARLERWEAGLEMAREYPLFGIGYNNWNTYYGPLSHNIFIQAVAELGFVGLGGFLALIGSTFVLNAQTRRILRRRFGPRSFMAHMAYGLDGALIGYMASGFFVTVLFYPYFWINLAMTTALHLAARSKVRASRVMTPVGMPPAPIPVGGMTSGRIA